MAFTLAKAQSNLGKMLGLVREKAGSVSKEHVVTGAKMLGDGIISVGTTVGLSAAHVYLDGGLEWHPSASSDFKLPIDGAVALAAAGGALYLSGTSGAKPLRTMAQSALTVFAFRKTYDMFAQQRRQSEGREPGGSFGQLPSFMGEDCTMGSEDERAILAELARL